ncbi:MAG TPA: secretin N-terminal domain-containing protein, partial [Planctomycetota bacterium]|nr:secretin N-terminal domain-containing protein [Planctomycetota bacterium]
MSRARATTRAFPLAVAALALACATPPSAPHADGAAAPALEASAEEALEAAQDAFPRTAASDAGEAAPNPPRADVDPGAGAPSPAEPLFDVAVHDAEIREFFLGLVEGTSYNVLLDPALEGRISLRMRQARVSQIMEALQDVYGYEIRQTGYGFHVLPATLKSRFYRVEYLNLAREGTSETRVSSGQVSDGARRQGSLRTPDLFVRDTTQESESLTGSRVQTRSRVDFWDDLAASLDAILGGREDRAVVTNAHSGVVVVRASPSELRDVERFLESVQARLNRQVILEARILEVELDAGHQSGINWAALFSVDGTEGLGAQTGGGSLFREGVSEIAGNAGNLDPRVLDLVEAASTSAFGGAFALAVGGRRFAAFIELLSTQGKVNTLSSPRIATVNNQKAVIKVGSDEFFVTDVSSTVVTGTTTTTTPEITLTPFFSGIALDVTPQVGEDGNIVLHVHPSVSEVVDQTKTITVGGEAQTLPLALSTIRESDSIVRAQSGQVVVI